MRDKAGAKIRGWKAHDAAAQHSVFDHRLHVTRTELQFADGSTMRNEFSNPQLNPKIDPALFTPNFGPITKSSSR